MPCRSVVLVPQPGIEPVPLALEAQRLNHGTAREVLDGEQFEIRALTWTCLSPGPGTQQALNRAHVVIGLDQLHLIKSALFHSPHTGSNSHGSFFPYTRF